MPFITDADHAAHEAALMPLFPLIKPTDYPTNEAYLRAVAIQMADFAKISYRNSQGSHWSTMLYIHGVKDREIHDTMLEAAKAHIGSDMNASLLVHTSLPKGKVIPQTIAILGLVIPTMTESQSDKTIDDTQTESTFKSPEQAATTADTPV